MKTPFLLLLLFILLTFSSCANTQTNTSNITSDKNINSDIADNSSKNGLANGDGEETSDDESDDKEDTDEDIKEKKIVYKLDNEHYFSGDKNISNTDPICQIYVDALNSYPLIDFFEAPMQPNTTLFSYPKWKQVIDEYNYKDAYLRIIHGYQYDFESFQKRKSELEKFYYHRWNNFANFEYGEADITRTYEKRMYYIKADIDNDNKSDDIIRIDSILYREIPVAYTIYSSSLYVFDGYPEKSFRDMDKDLNKELDHMWSIYNFFFYKGKTYIKDISYDVVSEEFSMMIIKEFNDKKELIPLCVII
jgi:hypothetical protein